MSGKQTIGVGIIGTGRRGLANLGCHMTRTTRRHGFVVRALYDRNPTRLREARDLLKSQWGGDGRHPDIALHDSYRAVIDDPAVDLVMVTTHSDGHREPAVAAMRSGKKVYLDKPIAAQVDDGIDIVRAEHETDNPLMMGFTRRYETPWRRAFEMVEDGAIGTLHAMLLRAVIPYHTYFNTWHRRREWSGGGLNDKASHHFDVLNWFARGRADRISAFGGRRVYVPDENAPERCLVCDRECPYRVELAEPGDKDKLSSFGSSWRDETQERWRLDNCVYLPGSDNRDHATVNVAFNNGVVANLFWVIFGPRAHDQETFELVGTSGRIRLCRHDGTLDVVTDYGRHTEVIDCRDENFESSHFGADLALMQDLRAFVDGRPPVVGAAEGLAATRMVYATHQSIDNDGAMVPMEEIDDVGL